MADRQHRRQLYFYGNAISDEVRAARGIATDSPAATRKMVGLCRALRSVGVGATIVSMGRGGGTRSGRLFRSEVDRIDGAPVIFGPVLDIPVLSQIVSAVWLGWIAVRLSRRRRGAVHLMYNQMSAFLPALVLLRMTRANIAADIEDGPIRHNAVAHARPLGTLSPGLFARFVTGGALLATSALASGTPIRPVKPYYGAIPAGNRARPAAMFDGGEPLVALFAGYLNDDTGLAVLTEAIRKMREAGDPLFDRLVIKIVGMGPGQDVMRDLNETLSGAPRVDILGRVGNEAYAALLDGTHIGLSLKPVGGDVSKTTFPSKTVEYAENGLALIATDISDVRALFGDSALYLEGNDAEELVERLRFALEQPTAVAEMAARGQRLVRDRLSYAAAGAELAAFLFAEPST